MPFQQPITRRQFTSSMAGAGAIVALTDSYAQARPLKTKVIIAVDGKESIAYLPLTIADQLGYFRQEGLEVLINDYQDATTATQALLAGTAEVCSGSFERTLQLQLKNQMVKAFVLQSKTPQIAFGVSTRNVPTYTALADLRGKRIGVLSLDSAAGLMTHLLLSNAGLNLQDVTLAAQGSPAAALTAIRSGQIDALCCSDPLMTMLEQKGDVKIISDARSLRGAAELFGGSMPSACFYANNEFILRNPNICQALTHGIVHSLKWLQTAGPGDIIRVVPDSYLLGDRALYLACFNKVRQCISLDGLLPDDGPSTVLKALSRFDSSLSKNSIDVRKTYTNVFAMRSKERFKV